MLLITRDYKERLENKMNFDYFLKKMKDVSPSDICAMLPMVTALALTPVIGYKYKRIWLVCEEPAEARDNGYYFFKYMCENHPEVNCIYAIKKHCKDSNRVKKLGKTVDHGSVPHWLIYFNGQYNISSQKGGKPNAALCSFFELNNIFHPHNVFLQHGIIKDNLDWLHKENTVLDYFVTSTIPEQQYVQENYGYRKDQIILTGLPRFDDLHEFVTKPNRIIVMPTWRKWLRLKSERNNELDTDVSTSSFIRNWELFLNSPELDEAIKKYNLEIIFYPHRLLQQNLTDFKIKNSSVKIASEKQYDIHDLIKSAAMLVTDYSSVFFDMIYMKKPVVFYQFDEDAYRKHHYEEGYFDYHNNPFGQSYKEHKEVVKTICQYAEKNYKVTSEYEEEHKRIFLYHDGYNSERVYKYLIASDNREDR